MSLILAIYRQLECQMITFQYMLCVTLVWCLEMATVAYPCLLPGPHKSNFNGSGYKFSVPKFKRLGKDFLQFRNKLLLFTLEKNPPSNIVRTFTIILVSLQFLF